MLSTCVIVMAVDEGEIEEDVRDDGVIEAKKVGKRKET